MNLEKAIQELKNGAKLCRAAWALDDGYLVLMPGMTHVWKIQLKPNPNAGNYIFSVEDLMGQDWQEFKLPVEVAV